MKLIRSSGILLHPTSFPGPHGIGDLGKAAYDFVDFLAKAKQSLWQILPLGPTGYGDSPYASFSSFAGNPLLINLEKLAAAGDLHPADLSNPPSFPIDKVDFGQVIKWKMPLLEKAADNFLNSAAPERKERYLAFCKEEAKWLDDFALFMAVKAHFDQKARAENRFGAMWNNYWERGIALRHSRSVAGWRKKVAPAIARQKVLQFYFFQQWDALHTYAGQHGIRIIGDIPIFVAPDSADVWANRRLFQLDGNGRPRVVAGVPPDYFSVTGQLWGNPLYNWQAVSKEGYRWWINRIKATLRMVDILRIDHFRGFEAYWEIPAAAKTAINGRWVKAPGLQFFETLTQELGELPIIAEDLGVITPGVVALRQRFGFPGMKVLQFAFDLGEAGALGASNPFLPHNYTRQAVVYTGTHDNDTTKGWYRQRSPAEKDMLRRYLGRPDDDIVWELIRLAMASTAAFAVIPFQDALNLDSDARMNTPSTLGGNWAWRYRPEALSNWVSGRLNEMVALYGRDPALWRKTQTKK